MAKRSLLLLAFLIPLAAQIGCSSPKVLWEHDDVRVESTEDPNLKKIVQNDRTLYYRVQDGMAYLDDHVLLGPVDEDGVLLEYLETMGFGRSDCIFWIFCNDFRWPLGIVPYEIHSSVNDWQRSQIELAIASIQNRTPIRFVSRESEHKDFVEFHAGNNPGACSSYLGRRGGKQRIHLGRNGCGTSTVIHEIGHALGLLHEHQRCDRDQHVTIHWNQMNPIYFFNFINLCFMGDDIGSFDPSSKMQYYSHSFSRAGNPTMTLKSGELILPSIHFSQGDIMTLHHLYDQEFQKR